MSSAYICIYIPEHTHTCVHTYTHVYTYTQSMFSVQIILKCILCNHTNQMHYMHVWNDQRTNLIKKSHYWKMLADQRGEDFFLTVTFICRCAQVGLDWRWLHQNDRRKSSALFFTIMWFVKIQASLLYK